MLTSHRSFRLEMLQVARLAPTLLQDASENVLQFLLSQQSPQGGFTDREGRVDLYYSIFGIEALSALQGTQPLVQTAHYLRSQYQQIEKLDFVHLCALARCAAALPDFTWKPEERENLLRHLAPYQAADGGFHTAAKRQQGSAYGSLLAWGAYDDLAQNFPEPEKFIHSIHQLALADGSFANEPNLPQGTVTATAAALTLLRLLEQPLPQSSIPWLLRQHHPEGGFVATPGILIPDLLSTATALHALSGLQADLSLVREACLDYIDTLWSAQGGFHGHWADDDLDVEYTYYGLLALGHLSV